MVRYQAHYSSPVPILGAVIDNIVGAVVVRFVIGQANEVILGVAAETGWTFFGVVDRDYRIPDSVLLDCRWEMPEIEQLDIKELGLELPRFEKLELETSPF